MQKKKITLNKLTVLGISQLSHVSSGSISGLIGNELTKNDKVAQELGGTKYCGTLSGDHIDSYEEVDLEGLVQKNN